MNYILKSIFVFTYCSFIFSDSSNIYNYKIKFFGLNVANCEVIYSDTLISNLSAKKIQYRVVTNSFIDKFFKVDNNYTLIIDKSNYNTLYYKKNTFQPKITNYLETDFSNGVLKYKNSSIIIEDDSKNIFSILYMIHSGDIDRLNSIKVIEREGKYYNFNYLLDTNKIIIEMNELDSNDKALIKHTDIFSWGLFLNNTKKTIIYNKDKKYIERCIFKKGITSLSASIVK